MHIARSNALICLKASAYLDLQKRQLQGEKVDSDDIFKHRNDIIGLGLTLTAEQSFTVPEEIQAELHRFFDAIQNNLPQDDFIERAGAFLHEWAEMDPTLLGDVSAERQTMDQIYECLKSSNIPVKNWIYGHFHESRTSFISGIRFKMLDIMELYELP